MGMLNNDIGIDWMMGPFEWWLWVNRIDRKMSSKGVKWLIIGTFMVSLGFVVMFAWEVVVKSLNVK